MNRLNQETRERAIRDHYYWREREKFRLLFEEFLLDKIDGYDFLTRYNSLQKKMKRLTDYISPKEIESVEVNPKSFGTRELIYEIDVTADLCGDKFMEEEERGVSSWYTDYFKELVRAIYEELLRKEDDLSIKNVLDEKVIKEIILFFITITFFSYCILKPELLQSLYNIFY